MAFIRRGIDLQFFTSNSGFVNLPNHLQRLMADWFITEDKVCSINKDDISEGIVYNMKAFIEIKNLLINGI